MNRKAFNFIIPILVCLVFAGCRQDAANSNGSSNVGSDIEDQTLVWEVDDKQIEFQGKGAYGEHNNLNRMYLNFTYGNEGLIISLSNFRGKFLGKHELTDRSIGTDQPAAVIRFNSSRPEGPSIFISKLCDPPIGFIEITAFDPRLNLISGRFEADLCALSMYVDEPDKRATTATFKNVQLSPLVN